MQDDRLGKKCSGGRLGGIRRAATLKVKRPDNAEGEVMALGVRM